MKRRTLIYLPSAQADLLEAVDYIRRDNPQAAGAWLERAEKTLGRLSSFPESGAIPKDPLLAARGYRLAVSGEHLAFYVVRPKTVEVRRVLHGRRLYSFLL